MKKLILLALYLLICSTRLIAQQASGSQSTTFPETKALPHSPEAAALGKYGDTPVGLHTGIVNVSVPVHEIKLKALSIPISLNYHASGLKVDELASNVGLGWSLSAGGMINVMTNGLNDFSPNGWVHTAQKTPQDRAIRKTFDYFASTPYYEDPDYLLNEAATEYATDTQPDLFSFSLPGMTGKFFYDQNGNYHLMPYQDVQVTYVQETSSTFPSSFEITDGMGNRYTFADRELVLTTSTNSCQTAVSPSDMPNTSVTYYLSEVVSAKGETVTFTYEGISYQFQNQKSETRYSRLQELSGCPATLPTCTEESSSTSSGLRLTSIETSYGERVLFNYSSLERLDLPGTKALQGIQVFYDGNTYPSKTFTLAQDYYLSGGTGSTDPNDYRLRLLKVQEAGKPAYSFTYNQMQLPSRLSLSQDHWGYYNASGNTTLLPASETDGFSSGADRSPNPSVMEAGTLVQVNYPTGGYTVFDYEPNYFYEEKYVTEVVTEGTGGSVGPDEPVRTTVFTLPIYATGVSATWDTGTETGQIGYSTIRLTGPDGYDKSFTGRMLTAVPLEGMVPGGEYTITITRPDPETTTTMGLLSIIWDKAEKRFVQQNTLAGGLRLATMTDYPLQGEAVVRHYEYVAADDMSRSSGVVMFQPSYEYVHYRQETDSEGKTTECSYYAQVSASMSPLSSVEGGNVAYTNVNVYVNDRSEGYTSHEFKVLGATSPFIAFPFPPKVVNHWLNGIPFRTIDYRYDNTTNTYKPVRIESRKYKTELGEGPNEFLVKGAKIALYKPEKFGSAAKEFAIEYYYLNASWYYLETETVEEFFPQGEEPLATTTYYYYDNPVHGLVNRKETVDSRGKNFKTELLYTLDKAQNDNVYEQMASLHRHAYLVEEATYLNGFLQNRQITDYKKYHASVFEPNILLEQVGIGPLEEKIRYHSYDAGSNLLQASREAGTNISYKWGYRGLYPVAECWNGTESEFFAENFEEPGVGVVSGEAHTGLRHAGGSYSVNWTRPNTSEYVISYWYRTSTGEWIYKEEDYLANTLDLSGGETYDDVLIYPKDAQITTYTYDPLVGMTSSTDANGRTTYYEYDSFGRLQAVKDDQRNVLKAYQYHYQSPQP